MAQLESPFAVDLHLDPLIWTRILRYDLQKRHHFPFTRGIFFEQTDLPRLQEAGIGGGMWSITTNPFRTAHGRAKAFRKNAEAFLSFIKKFPQELKLISMPADLEQAEKPGFSHTTPHAVWLAVQGGNAFDADLALIEKFAPALSRVTLMHLTHSKIGTASIPLSPFRNRGLTDFGRELVSKLNAQKVFVDLAHADRETFQDALEVHQKGVPAIVTHTGVSGVNPHWRNLDDVQLKQIANTGGVIGVMFHGAYLGKRGTGIERVIAHLKHIQKVAGHDFAAIGSDWDGFIIPPHDLRTCLEFPKLIQAMSKSGMSEIQIEKILSGNFLRAFRALRGNS